MRRFFIISGAVCILFLVLGCGEDSKTPEQISDDFPIATINNPGEGARFSQDVKIVFLGKGIDTQDGNLPDSQLIWSSDKDGNIGSGESYIDSLLSIDTHIIRLEVTDSDDNSSVDSISIVVFIDSTMVSVPSTVGFYMGWDDGVDTTGMNEEPIHTVALDEFQMGKYEVTYSLWLKVRTWGESNGYTFCNDGQQGSDVALSTIQHPVVNISWRDCIAWCNAYSEKEGLTPVYYTSSAKMELYKDSSTGNDIKYDCVDWNENGFRLPTEAEWEYAARYIDGADYVDGDKHSGYNVNADEDDCAWYDNNSMYTTHGVGEKVANSLGITDMSGNIFEWCWDWYQNYTGISENNPHGPYIGMNRVLRGGSWIDYSENCHTSKRTFFIPGSVSDNWGFRVCRSGF